ncbi:MAG TPA: hypothetical protein PK472_02525 [Pseudomonadota bacterium]|nr:hypothetical protein [Pseudomonadota bacterium]
MNSYSLLSVLVMGSLLLAPPVGAAPVVVKSDWRQIKPPPLHARWTRCTPQPASASA